MPQHDLVLDNGSGAAFRGDANNALAALGSTMKGPNAPPAPIAGMMWLDDDTPSASVWTLKLYDGADWISIATFDISANTWAPVITRLALGAGSAGVPALTLGDADTGIYGSGSAIGYSHDGVLRFLMQPNATRIRHDGNTLLFLDMPGASASVSATTQIVAANESGWGVTSINSTLNTDGSADLQLLTTPPGARNTGRASARVTIPGSGAISLTGDVDIAGNLRFNSGYGSAALAFGVRAWVNFNGTGTVAIRGSGGVTSITDNATGDYTVNFNFTMPDVNYCFTINGVAGTSSFLGDVPSGGMTTTSLRINTRRVDTRALEDFSIISVTIVR